QLAELDRRDLLARHRLECRAKKVDERYAWNGCRVLEGEEETETCPLIRRQLEHILTLPIDRAFCHLVFRVAHQRVRERTLARAVRSHDRVDLTSTYLQVHAFENLFTFDVDAEVVDDQNSVRVSHTPGCPSFCRLIFGS